MTATPTAEGSPLPAGHFHSLDALRGLAAIAVVFWHWQCFFYKGVELGEFNAASQPLYPQMKAFYLEGWRAVDLFFCLSGFIFFWLYAERIENRRIGAAEFALRRFSRLYPLHLATLLAVALFQWIARSWSGSFFVYPENDLYHFVLHLFFIPNLGLERGLSFNAPIWSVSIEVILYGLFFCLCATGLRRWWMLVLLVAIGLTMSATHGRNLGRGICCFFSGGLVFLAFAWMHARALPRTPWVAPLLAATAWLATALLRGTIAPPAAGTPETPFRGILEGLLFGQFLFPLTILALALTETNRPGFGRRLAVLGDMSYAIYLLHFPMIMVFAGAAALAGKPPEIFLSTSMLVLFMTVLLAASWCSHRWLERPAQRLLRTRLTCLPSRSTTAES